MAILVDGEWMSLRAASDRYGVPVMTISGRISRGWDPDEAAKTPSGPKNNFVGHYRKWDRRRAEDMLSLGQRLAREILGVSSNTYWRIKKAYEQGKLPDRIVETEFEGEPGASGRDFEASEGVGSSGE